MMAWVRLWILVGVLAVAACAPQGGSYQRGSHQGGVLRESIDYESKGWDAYQRGDYSVAFQAWFKDAQRGLAYAQFNIGYLFKEGLGVTQDDKVAVYWYRKAAKQGHAYAQHNLELIYGERTEGSPPLETSLYDLKATGTGFSVSSNGYILTNYHVIDGCAIVRVTSPLSVVRVVARDEVNDLALLWHSSGELLSPVGWRDGSEVRLGEEIVIAGYPLQGILTSDLGVTTGSVSALSGLGGYRPHFQISAPVQPGNSGSPLLDRAGQVIGVVVSELDEAATLKNTGSLPQNVNFAIRSEVAFKFMDSNKIPYIRGKSAMATWTWIKSLSGLSTEDIAEQARSHTVRVECWN